MARGSVRSGSPLVNESCRFVQPCLTTLLAKYSVRRQAARRLQTSRFFAWYGVIPPARERVAAQEPPKAKSRSMKQTMFGHGFCCVFRTAGNEAAGDRQKRRDGAFVKPQEICGHALHLPRPRCTAAKTCIISASSWANFNVSTLLRGCNTRSSGRASSRKWFR